jgi:hypothetical protein
MHQAATMAPLRSLGCGLPELTRLLISGLVASYRLHRGILRALMVYARAHRDPDFRRQADQLNAANLRRVEELLLPYATEMSHPDPALAIRTGLCFVASVLREAVLVAGEAPRLPIAEERLGEELTRLYLGYLGVAVPVSAPATPVAGDIQRGSPSGGPKRTHQVA